MSTFNIRYGGQIESLPEGFNFNDNYGTDRLNIKVNSTSTMKLGLTTNTNAQEYCHFSIRIGGQTAYIGRVSSTSYASGNAVNYNGSVTTSRKQSILTSSNYTTSYATSVCPNVTSSMHTSTDYQRVLTRDVTASQTRNSGSGDGTATYEHSLETYTNSTGSTVTTRTASENVPYLTYYTYSAVEYVDVYGTNARTISRAFPAVGSKKIMSMSSTNAYTSKSSRTYYYARGTNYNAVMNDRNYYTKADTYSAGYNDWTSYTFSTTRRSVSTSASNTVKSSVINPSYDVTSKVSGSWPATPGSLNYSSRYYTSTKAFSTTAAYTYSCSITSYSKTTYMSRETRAGWNTWGTPGTAGAIATLYSSSTRYSYWWTSCEKYTGHSYYYDTIYRTSATYSTTNVSETLHNMNI